MKRNKDLDAAVDERLVAAIDRANYQITLNAQKQNARLKLDTDLVYAAHGGLFKADPALISFVEVLLNRDQEDAVLMDVNKNPIHIPDLRDFQDSLLERYYQATNEFLAEFKKIQKARKTESLVD